MNKHIVFTALLVSSTSSIAADARPTMAGIDSPDDPRAREVYSYQCNEWANSNNFGSPAAKDAYINECISDMPKIRPFGFDDSE